MINQKEFDKLYDDLLVEFYNKMNRPNSLKRYAMIYPCDGKYYDKTKLMFCGQAINGWFGNGWKLSDLKTEKGKNKIKKNSKQESENEWDFDDLEEKCKTKPFFRIVKAILIDHYNIDPAKYPSYFIWTNLMKIAPFERGNPNNTEFNAQINACTKIFKYELDYYKPKNVIIFSGAIEGDSNWAYNFMKELGNKHPRDNSSGKIIEELYKYKSTNIITVIRPERKPKGVTEELIINEIIKKIV